MIILIVAVLLFLFFCFLTWQFTKTWRATHVTFAFLTFVMAMLFCLVAGANLKNQLAWKQRVYNFEKDVERKEADKLRLGFGELAAVRQSQPSVRTLKADLGRLLLERGRVWRHVVPANTQNVNAIQLAFPQPVAPPPAPDVPPPADDAAAPPLAATPGPVIDPNTTVYAFKERQTPEGLRVPAVYLGEYEVTTVAGNMLTLTPTANAQLDPQQVQEIRTADATWSLYETMPLDSHEVFDEMTAEQLMALMPPPPGVPQEDYERLIQSYVRDLERAEPDDAPENHWTKVRFVKPVPDNYSVVTGIFKQVDSEGDQPPLSSEHFDLAGRAIVPQLRRGTLADFDIEQIEFAILDEATAQQLIEDGYAEMVEPVYVRELNDYAFGMHELADRLRSTTEAIQRADRDIKLMQDAIAKAQQQIDFREEEKGKLQEDLQKFTAERDAISEYALAVAAELQETRTQLSVSYRSIHALEQELDRISALLTDQVNRRVSEARASN